MSVGRLTVRSVAHRVGGLTAVLTGALGVGGARAASAPAARALGFPVRMQDQRPASLSREVVAAAEGINDAALIRHLTVLSTDSLRERGTPGPAQEATAQYVADQLQQLGLRPFGDRTGDTTRSWFQRYPVPGQLRLSYAQSMLRLERKLRSGAKTAISEQGRPARQTVTIDFAAARFIAEAGAPLLDPGQLGDFGPEPKPLPLVLLTGPQTPASIAAAQLANRAVLYLPPAGMDSATEQVVLRQLYAASNGVLLLRAADRRTTNDSVRFEGRAHTAQQQPIALVDFSLRKAMPAVHWSWAIELRPGLLDEWLAATGVDVAAARAGAASQVRDLGTELWFDAVPAPIAAPRTAPNVVGLIEGTDSALKRSYLVLATSLDGAGAADNAAGLPTLLAVAEAFRRPGAAPRRSIIVLATSGAAAGSWGSSYFADRLASRYPRSVVNLTLNLSGRAAGDPTAILDGEEDVDFGQSSAWLLASHPELGVTLHDGGTAAAPGGEHFPFVQAGLPSLYLHDHADADSGGAAAAARTTPRPSVSPAGAASPMVDAASLARVGRFAFYLAEVLAETPTVRWTPAGRLRFAAVAVP